MATYPAVIRDMDHGTLVSFIHRRSLIVPSYQRNFEWPTKLVESFIEDIQDEYQNGKMLYLGVLLFKQRDTSYVVIDGQQRVTLFLLLLRALYEKEGLDNNIKREINQFLKHTSIQRDDGRHHILELNEREQNALFKKIVLDGESTFSDIDEKEKKIIKKMIRAYNIVKINLNDKSSRDANRLFQYLKDGLEVSVIYLESDVNEEKIFESINAKKLELSQDELIKSYIASNSSDKMIKKWNNVKKKFGDKRLFNKFIDVFCQSTASRGGYVNKDSYYYIKKKYEKNVKNFLREFEEHSVFYEQIIRPKLGRRATKFVEPTYVGLNIINGLKFTALHPILLRALRNKGKQHAQFSELISLLERIYFVKRVLLEELPQKIKDEVYPIMYEIDSPAKLKKVNKKLRSILSDLDTEENKNKLSLYRQRLIGNKPDNKTVSFILLRILSKKDPQTAATLLKLGDKSVEHILPRHPDEKCKKEILSIIENDATLKSKLSSYEESEKISRYVNVYAYVLGNFIVIAPYENTLLRNSGFAKKRTELEKITHNTLAKEVAKYERWIPENIQDHGNVLAEEYFSV